MPRIRPATRSRSISSTVRRARRAAGLTQQQLASACGVTLRTVQHWEAGTRLIPSDRLRAASLALHLPIDALVP